MKHVKIKHGLCKKCGHYGEDCEGTEVSHTPTPWYISRTSPLRANSATIVGDNGVAVGAPHLSKATIEANAKFIVRAVNSHDDLLAAAKLALEYIDRLPLNVKPDGMLPPFYELTTAIAKAEGR